MFKSGPKITPKIAVGKLPLKYLEITKNNEFSDFINFLFLLLVLIF